MTVPDSRGRVSRLLGQYIIKFKFQFKFGLFNLGIIGISCFLLWAEAHFAIERLLAAGVVANEDAVAQMRLISAILGKTGLLLSAFVFGLSLFLSHFIAGPVFRFEKIFQEIREGRLGILIRLREKDEFQDTANALNQALAGLRNKIQKERDATIDIVKEFTRVLEEAGHSGEAAQLNKRFSDIQADPQGVKISL